MQPFQHWKTATYISLKFRHHHHPPIHLVSITPHPYSILYDICISPPPNPVLRIPLITTPCATAPSENNPFACWKGRSCRVARLQKHADTRVVGIECKWETEVSAYIAMRLPSQIPNSNIVTTAWSAKQLHSCLPNGKPRRRREEQRYFLLI
jgi:hypothetical protein